jgi:sugar (pentulose or hexulose) kinase
VYELLDAKAAAVPPGCDGLVCLDHWQGNRCPHKDPHARGALWGFTLAHGPGHVVRAVYEGTACGTRAILDDLAAHGFPLRRLFAGGGGARSRLWLEIVASVLGLPLERPLREEGSAYGAALLAGVAAGSFPNAAEAVAACVRVRETIEPNADWAKAYAEGYARFRALYPALRRLEDR